MENADIDKQKDIKLVEYNNTLNGVRNYIMNSGIHVMPNNIVQLIILSLKMRINAKCDNDIDNELFLFATLLKMKHEDVSDSISIDYLIQEILNFINMLKNNPKKSEINSENKEVDDNETVNNDKTVNETPKIKDDGEIGEMPFEIPFEWYYLHFIQNLNFIKNSVKRSIEPLYINTKNYINRLYNTNNTKFCTPTTKISSESSETSDKSSDKSNDKSSDKSNDKSSDKSTDKSTENKDINAEIKSETNDKSTENKTPIEETNKIEDSEVRVNNLVVTI